MGSPDTAPAPTAPDDTDAAPVNDPPPGQWAADPCKWVVLQSGRLGLPLPKLKCGKQTYLATDGHTRLCPHGENLQTISQRHDRPTGAACTCENLDGLSIGGKQTTPTGWIDPPVKYYDVLCASDAEQAVLPGGRAARRIPYTEGPCAMWMLACGGIRCRHGNSQAVLKAIAKGNTKHKPRRPCGCQVSYRSWRRKRLQTRLVASPPSSPPPQ